MVVRITKIDDRETIQPIDAPPVCAFCVHWDVGETSCEAFEEIPDDIFLGGETHNKPRKGDNGIVFESIKKG